MVVLDLDQIGLLVHGSLLLHLPLHLFRLHKARPLAVGPSLPLLRHFRGLAPSLNTSNVEATLVGGGRIFDNGRGFDPGVGFERGNHEVVLVIPEGVVEGLRLGQYQAHMIRRQDDRLV